MSNNLDSHALRAAKKAWTEEVRSARAKAATLAGQIATASDDWTSAGMAWGYINHKRVAQMAQVASLSGSGATLLEYCSLHRITDQDGIILKPKDLELSDNYFRNSVYDWFDYGDDQRLHALYSEMVDQIGRGSRVLHLEQDSWTKARVRDLVRPGLLLFLNKGVYFSSVHKTKENDHRRCTTFKNKVRIEFFVDTIDMFGTTSMSVSYHGHQTCASLLLVKSLSANEKGELVISCTPLALGVGFQAVETSKSIQNGE
jgi:hypothetical protein